MHAEQTRTVEERVQAGAALLDEKRPGWWQQDGIPRLSHLSIASPCNCVLGQLYGYYYDGLTRVFPGPWNALPVGFCGDTPRDTKALTAAWKALIAARRETASHAR